MFSLNVCNSLISQLAESALQMVIGVKLTEKYFKTSNPFPSQCLCSLFTWLDVILHECGVRMKTYFAYLKNCTAVGLQTPFFFTVEK